MNFIWSEQQGTRAVDRHHVGRQLEMCTQIAPELAGVALLDHQNALHAPQGRRESFGLRRRNEPHGDEFHRDSGTARHLDRFANGGGGRSPSHDGEFSVAFDVRPQAAIVEPIDLALALVELRDVVLGLARRRADGRIPEPESRTPPTRLRVVLVSES